MMLSPEELKRYARHLFLEEVGMDGQDKLRNARILVIGAGGLGCPVLQYLTAAGVGTIGIVDGDIVELSNLQRQVLFSVEDIGQNKAEAAIRKLRKQNHHVAFRAYPVYLSASNALAVISQYDIVVDGSDNFATRYLVNDASVMLKKILVFGSIFKFDGQVSVFNYQEGPTYRCLYPEPPAIGEMPNCAETGVLGVLPGICGTLMANEVIKMILGLGEILSGKLLSFDALTMQFDLFNIETNPTNKTISELIDYDLFCDAVEEITAQQLKSKIAAKEDFQLVDVREETEYNERNIGGLLIPLKTLENNLYKLSPGKEVIVHCKSGARSRQAVSMLKQKGFKKVVSLKNGLLDF